MGANPILCSIIGEDADGDEFIQLLKETKQSTEGILRVRDRKTTKKSRVIGNNHQMLRIDSEQIDPINSQLSNQFFNKIKGIVDSQKIDCVIFEDYDKGVITKKLIERVVELCSKKGIPTSVDPKKRNFMDYKGATLFKPNLKELREGLEIEVDPKDLESVKSAAQALQAIIHAEHVMVTLSEHGVCITEEEAMHHIPAHIRQVSDVSGAGDTVISIVACALAAGLDAQRTAALANLGGGLVCEHVGVVPIDAQDLMREVFQVVSRHWRGMCDLPKSGLALTKDYAAFDAETRFGPVSVKTECAGPCQSGAILRGVAKPTDCAAFGTECTPDHPKGVTMVSSEGACAAYFRYRRTDEQGRRG